MIDKKHWKLIARLYDEQSRTVDDLPHTKEESWMLKQLIELTGSDPSQFTRRRLWVTIMKMRKKKGCLPHKTERYVKGQAEQKQNRLGPGLGLLGKLP